MSDDNDCRKVWECDTIRCEEGRKADMWLWQASSAIVLAMQFYTIQCNYTHNAIQFKALAEEFF